MNKCKRCDQDNIKVGITNLTSGATVYPLYCASCGYVFMQYVKKAVALNYAKTNGPLQYVKTRTAEYQEKNQTNVQCVVCNANEGELHHWAPHHLFGDEAEKWPTSYLCRACHKKWHDLVTPNMSKI